MSDDDVLYVPIRAGLDGGARALVGPFEDGRIVLFAYSTPEKLDECCGKQQRRVRVDMTALDRLESRSERSEVVLLDAALPDDLRRALAEEHAAAEEQSHAPQSWLQSPVGRHRQGR